MLICIVESVENDKLTQFMCSVYRSSRFACLWE